MKLQVLCLLVGVTVASAGVTGRSFGDIKSFRTFLDTTSRGKYQEPLNAELEKRQNAEERSGKFEGDILLSEEQKNELMKEYLGQRNAITDITKLWPNRVLYYNITSSDFSLEQIAAIRSALDYMEKVSCLKFRAPVNKNAVVVTGKSEGCFSSVGFIGGIQYLNLAPSALGTSCFRNGTIMHEFLHALGFFHMQSTHNRDEYVEIVWDKITPGKESNFYHYSQEQVSNLGVPYDYGSVLHYSEYGFSIDGSKTIVPLKETNLDIGQRLDMSTGDIIKLNKLYRCPGY